MWTGPNEGAVRVRNARGRSVTVAGTFVRVAAGAAAAGGSVGGVVVSDAARNSSKAAFSG